MNYEIDSLDNLEKPIYIDSGSTDWISDTPWVHPTDYDLRKCIKIQVEIHRSFKLLTITFYYNVYEDRKEHLIEIPFWSSSEELKALELVKKYTDLNIIIGNVA